MTDTIQLDRATAERILASLMGCHETTAGSYIYLLINICDLSHALAAQPVQPAPLKDLTYQQMLQMYVADKDAGAHHSPESNYYAGIKAAVRTGGAG